MFEKIYNPRTKRYVKSDGKVGRNVIKNYQKYLNKNHMIGGSPKKNDGYSDHRNKKHIRIFHATWCGHCIQSMPIFTELVKNVYDTFKFTLHDIDKTNKQGKKVHEKIMKKLNVQSFPSIIWDKLTSINRNSPTDHYEAFIGNRNINDILGWAKNL